MLAAAKHFAVSVPRSYVVSWLNLVALDVVPLEFHAEAWSLGKDDVALVVERVRDRLQVGRRRLEIEPGA